MKKLSLIVTGILAFCAVCAAKDAVVVVYPSGLKPVMVPEDSVILQACPLMKDYVVSYKDEADLDSIVASIEDYFSENTLSKTYSLQFRDKRTKTLLRKADVGRPKIISLTGDSDKDQLLLGIFAAVAALLCILLVILVDKIRKARAIVVILEVVLVLGTLGCAGLSILLLLSLGLKYVMMICGPALIIGIILIALLGGAGSTKSAARRREKADKALSETTKRGYKVGDKHFDNRSDAVMYVRQFSYMDESWITPE